MTPRRLDNYLLTRRKAVGLSQDEIAFLLGGTSGTKVCRYERRLRVPPLDTALAFEAVLGTSVRDLFAGRSHKMERTIRRRVRFLIRELEGATQDPLTVRKLTRLRAIAAGEAARPAHTL